MPIKIPDNLPASKILKEENIFVMNETRATTQKIRPLKLLILNIMPTKIVTETQLLRLLSNSPLQIEVDWIHMASHESKNVSKEHLLAFYKTFDDIKERVYKRKYPSCYQSNSKRSWSKRKNVIYANSYCNNWNYAWSWFGKFNYVTWKRKSIRKIRRIIHILLF